MKEYTFIYYDSVFDFNAGKRSYFVFTASRFSVAFKAFCDFVTKSCFYYFTFSNVYHVKTKRTVHCRILPSKYYYTLDLLRKIPNEV